MIVIKYSDETAQETIYNIIQGIHTLTNEQVIVIPQDWEAFTDCSSQELLRIRNQIDEALRRKEIINEM